MSATVVEAASYVRKIVSNESSGWGDDTEALRRIANKVKVSFWTLNNLRTGKAKTINAEVRDRIRAFFIEHCEEQAGRLLHEAEMARRVGIGNDDLESVADEIRALAARLAAAKSNAKDAA